MEIQSYLDRINYNQSVRANAHTLRGLHRAHMFAVPFENLDIVPLQRPIQLDEQALLDKIVLRKRGGFCYELNGAFAWLLKKIGFEVSYLNGRVYRDDGSLGIDFDHLALLVRTPGQSARWLADVGFGDSFIEPLSFEIGNEHVEGLRAYKLEETKDGFVMWQRDYDGRWSHQYFFDLTERKFPEDYQAGCVYHQNPSLSSLGREGIISMANAEGRVSLKKENLAVTVNGQREERVVTREDYPILLKKYFGIVL